MMRLDQAVVKLLALNAEHSSIRPSGRGDSSASTAVITTKNKDGLEISYFLKSITRTNAEAMIEGEYASLEAIHATVPGICPIVLGKGKYETSPSTHFLALEFLNLSGSSTASLAVKLAKMHTTRAPVPKGYERVQFGFPVTTYCGDTPQDNTYKEFWPDFFAENRLYSVLRCAEARRGVDEQLGSLVKQTAVHVVPALLGIKHLNGGRQIDPVVVHGDLWTGNSALHVSSSGKFEDKIFDPSACYAHNEYELGIVRMFGGFDNDFFDEYHKLVPKTEPSDEYEDRIALYGLYHYLNHYTLFGGGYRGMSINIMKRLLDKYANPSAASST